VDEKYNLIAGHGRLEAARAEGLEEINCVVVEGLTDAQRKAFVIADNKLTENATWDNELLALEFGELKELGFDIGLTGFDADEIERLFAAGTDDVVDDDFDIDSALEEEPIARLGDVWALGRHRLVVGDATKTEDVALLMGGKKANACITDPPYNCDITGGAHVKGKAKGGMKIMNDNMPGKEFYAFLLAAFENIYESLAPGAAFYCFHSDGEKVNFCNAAVDAGFHYSTTCIWVKDTLVLGRADYQQRHEPCLYCFKPGERHKWYADRKQTTVWEFPRPKRSELHPTMKSLELLAYPLGNSTAANAIVLDPFGGSGSTLIVCEQTERACHMMELDEKYASVILRRYAELKGGGMDISCERGGETIAYADLAKEVGNDG
jgi:DNA modification methylase